MFLFSYISRHMETEPLNARRLLFWLPILSLIWFNASCGQHNGASGQRRGSDSLIKASNDTAISLTGVWVNKAYLDKESQPKAVNSLKSSRTRFEICPIRFTPFEFVSPEFGGIMLESGGSKNVVKNRLRSKTATEFLGLWEELHNSGFAVVSASGADALTSLYGNIGSFKWTKS
jgi:hypothetical protein